MVDWSFFKSPLIRYLRVHENIASFVSVRILKWFLTLENKYGESGKYSSPPATFAKIRFFVILVVRVSATKSLQEWVYSMLSHTWVSSIFFKKLLFLTDFLQIHSWISQGLRKDLMANLYREWKNVFWKIYFYFTLKD